MCEDDVSIQWYECEIFYFELIIYIKIERLPLSPPKINSLKKMLVASLLENYSEL